MSSDNVSSDNASALVVEDTFLSFCLRDKTLTVTVKDDHLPSDDEWDFAKKTVRQFYKGALQSVHRMNLVFDIRRMGALPWARYIDWAALLNELREQTMQCIHRSAVVTDSMVVRVTVNAFFALYQTARPTEFCETLDMAHAFVTTYASESEGLYLPPGSEMTTAPVASTTQEKRIFQEVASKQGEVAHAHESPA